MKRIISIVSARPNFVKLAAVHHALERHAPKIEHRIVHTGQHYDPLLSTMFFIQLNIPPPTWNLDVHGGEREDVIRRTREELLPRLRGEEGKPDIVLVYGDVNGALGGAQAANQLGIRLGHVEAGLRSGDLTMPEEHNRIAIDKLADLLFCSEQSGIDNLDREGVPGKRFLVGNTMIDTLADMLGFVSTKARFPIDLPDQFAVVTMHRPSNVDAPDALRQNLTFLSEVAQHISLILPAHPRMRKALRDFGMEKNVPDQLWIIDPLEYLSFLHLMQLSKFIITDSGGIQEEAVMLLKRCFTLRKNTERPSTIKSGSNVLIDPSVAEDRNTVFEFAVRPGAVEVKIPPLWDGRAGERIAQHMSHFLSEQ